MMCTLVCVCGRDARQVADDVLMDVFMSSPVAVTPSDATKRQITYQQLREINRKRAQAAAAPHHSGEGNQEAS